MAGQYDSYDGLLIPERGTMGWRVRDPDGGVWYPDAQAETEILEDEDPALLAVLICRDQPDRGTWRD